MSGAVGEGQAQGLPESPLLAEAARALLLAKQWAWIVDCDWQLVFLSEEMRRSFGYEDMTLPVPMLGTRWVDETLAARAGPTTVDLIKEMASELGGLMLADLGYDGVEAQVDPRIREAFDHLLPVDASVQTFSLFGNDGHGERGFHSVCTAFRVRDGNGRLVGTVCPFKPAAGMSTLAFAGHGDPAYHERLGRAALPARRPAAVLLADLEGSTPLARRLPTASYFELVRRLVRAADECVIDAGGLLGRHTGDGVAAFFLADEAGSESAAVRSSIVAAQELRELLPSIAINSGLDADEVIVRMGLHWGSTLFVGGIASNGRGEVVALGDEVNETARIEVCATGGRILASKDLVERLDPPDAAALRLDPTQTNYTALGDLSQATEKTRRDARAISVCEI